MSIMLDGLQQVYNSGTATVDTMIGGQQILMSGIGTVIDMSGGTQTINDLGIGTVSA